MPYILNNVNFQTNPWRKTIIVPPSGTYTTFDSDDFPDENPQTNWDQSFTVGEAVETGGKWRIPTQNFVRNDRKLTISPPYDASKPWRVEVDFFIDFSFLYCTFGIMFGRNAVAQGSTAFGAVIGYQHDPVTPPRWSFRTGGFGILLQRLISQPGNGKFNLVLQNWTGAGGVKFYANGVEITELATTAAARDPLDSYGFFAQTCNNPFGVENNPNGAAADRFRFSCNL